MHELERETRLELATPTLARLCSTTELFPLNMHHKRYGGYSNDAASYVKVSESIRQYLNRFLNP